MAKAGGIGLAPTIEREMIRMQQMNGAAGTTPAAATAAYATTSASSTTPAAKAPATGEDDD
jgi:hypothetical protein